MGISINIPPNINIAFIVIILLLSYRKYSLLRRAARARANERSSFLVVGGMPLINYI
jgi:hypothetical protein